jgi:hypothetical protein
MSDQESDNLRLALTELDDSDREVTGWEASFLESVIYKQSGELSSKQKASAIKMLEKYGIDF